MRPIRIRTIAILSFLSLACTHRVESTRDHARWDVKTLQDFDTEWIISGGLYPAEPTSIIDLNSLNPPEELHNTSPRQTRETSLVVIGGWITKRPVIEEDGDVHLILWSEDRNAKLTAEVPNADSPELANSRFGEYYRAVHKWIADSVISRGEYPCHVMVTGVRYFDNSHHKDGRYSVEVHPVLGIRWAKH